MYSRSYSDYYTNRKCSSQCCKGGINNNISNGFGAILLTNPYNPGTIYYNQILTVPDT